MWIQIPLTRIKSKETINKIEITNIDRLLSTDEKRKIATFYRQEEAKRTKYDLEPAWKIPASVQAQRRPSATGRTWDNFMEGWKRDPEKSEAPTTICPLEATSEKVDLELQTSAESDHQTEVTVDIITQTIENRVNSHTEATKEVRQSLLKAKEYLKEFEGVSKTQMRKMMYKERIKKTRDQKRQRQTQP